MKPISLGPLEQEVMGCVWQHSDITAREVCDCLNKKRPIAYNTIQTIMTRLVDKKVLTRELKGKTHYYKSAHGKRQTIQSAIQSKMTSFVNQFGEEAIVAYIDGLDDISDETRQEIIEKLEKK